MLSAHETGREACVNTPIERNVGAKRILVVTFSTVTGGGYILRVGTQNCRYPKPG
jgi:hypothetical protein